MDADIPASVFVTIGAAGWQAVLDDAPALCRQAARAALAKGAGASWLTAAELGITLADDEAIRHLNARHRDQDRATNVLAFPLLDLDHGRPLQAQGPGPLLLGDVIVALETVCAEARSASRPLGAHLSHLIVHGTLHLLGFDHGDEDEAQVMEDLERVVMADLGLADPYAEPAAAPSGRDQHAPEAV
jgi:probable rRNA maturation factor